MRIGNKYKKLLKNIGIFTLGNFGSKIISFLMVPLYTAILSTKDYGTVDLVSTTVQLILPILTLCIYESTLRFGMDGEYNKEDVLSTSLNIILKGACVLFTVILFCSISEIIKVGNEYWAFFLFSFILGALNNCLGVYLKTINRTSVIAISGIGCTFLTCACNIVFLVFLDFGINGYMISNVIGILFQVLYQLIVGKIYNDIHIKRYNNLYKPMLAYSIPLIANAIAWWINNVSDRYILTAFQGVDISGIYSVSYKIPTILTTVQSVFYSAWSISAIAEFNERDEDGFIGNNYSLYSSASAILCALLVLMNIPMARVLYSGDYFIAWKCVPFLLVGTILNGMAQFEGTLFAAAKRTKMVSSTTIIGAIINTVLNIILIPNFSAVGAAIATMVGYGCTWLLRTLFMQKFVKMKVNWVTNSIVILLLIAQAVMATLDAFYFLQIIVLLFVVFMYKDYLRKALLLFKCPK